MVVASYRISSFSRVQADKPSAPRIKGVVSERRQTFQVKSKESSVTAGSKGIRGAGRISQEQVGNEAF